MFNKLFVRDAAERAIATFAQTLIAVLSVAVAAGQGIEAVPWLSVMSASLLAALLSVAKSVYALKATEGNSASLVVDNVKNKAE